MTPRYQDIMDYWDDDAEHLALEHQVWDPTPWVIDLRSPYPGSTPASNHPGDIDRMTHINWLRDNLGPESWPIHGEPGNWRLSGATVNGETWLGFRTENMMIQFCEAFPQSIIRAGNGLT